MAGLRALMLAGTFAAGIVAADRLRPSLAAGLTIGLLGVGSLLAAWRLQRRAGEPATGELLPRITTPVAALILGGTLAVGFANLGLRSAGFDRVVTPSLDGRVVEVRGRVLSDPRQVGRAVIFTVRTESLDGVEVRERLSVRAYDPNTAPSLGDDVQIMAKIQALRPGDSFDAALRRRGVAAGAIAVSEVEVTSATDNPFLAASNRVRARMRAMAERMAARGDAGLVLGLTIGDLRLVPENVREDLRATSLTHLTAVSGLHVGIVLGAALLLMRWLRLSRPVQVAGGIAVVGFFAVVTRWGPSVLRASVMASLALAAFLFGRRYHALWGLGLAFVTLLALDPNLAWSVGFQLSFAATLGILAAAPTLAERWRALPGGLRQALAVAVSAQAAVTPLLALHFGRVSLVSVPANLAAVPLAAPVMLLGFSGSAMGAVWEPAGVPAFWLATALAGWLRRVAHLFASLPHATLPVPDLGGWGLLLLYLGLGALLLLLAGKSRIALRAAAVGAVLWAILSMSASGAAPPPEGLRMTFFDVGQGDATLIESPDGARVLIDGGPDPHYLASVLRRQGIRRLDMVVFTHAHFDHVNGLVEVLLTKTVREAIDPGVPNPYARQLPPERRPKAVTEGDAYRIGEMTVEILGPPPLLRDRAVELGEAAAEQEGALLNDASVVAKITWRGECGIFPGDLEEEGQTVTVESHERRLECRVLKAPHHGSGRLVEEFVASVAPRWVVISSGRNSFGHPSERAIRMFERAGAQVLRTDRMGDVVLVVDQHGRVSMP